MRSTTPCVPSLRWPLIKSTAMNVNLKSKLVFLTGAGSGIGRALALNLAARGARLILTDIGEKGLAETAALVVAQCPSAFVVTRVLDVANRVAFHALADEMQAQLGPVDVVINNAGVALIQPVSEHNYADFEWLMGINFWGVVHGSQAFLPAMLTRKGGLIVNVSSLYGLMGWPSQAAYCAAKFGVRGYTEAMRHDLHGSGVRAVCIHPGGIATNIVNDARFTKDDLGRTDHGALKKDFNKVAKTTPAQAAETIVRGIERGRERIVIGPDAKFLSFWQRLRPESYFGLIRWLQQYFR